MELEKTTINGKEILSSSPKNDRDYKIITYDFKRPDMFSLDQIRTIFVMHEIFAQKASLTLSSMLRQKVKIEVNSVDQLTFGEFIDSIPKPSTLIKVDMSPLKQPSVLQIDPNITFSLNDRLYGGSGSSDNGNGELSGIEKSVLLKVSERLMINLKDSWEKVVDLNPKTEQIETHPEYIAIANPTEMVFLVSFNIKIGEVNGFMNFCVPYITIEPIIGKFSAEYWYSFKRKDDHETLSNSMVSSLKLDSEIITQTQSISLKRLGLLKKGSLIKLEGFSEGLSTLRVGGENVLKTKFGKRGSKSIFKIENRDSGNLDIQEVLKISSAERESQEIRDNMSDISNKVSSISDNLIRRIEELSNNQDHLNDQVLLGIKPDSVAVEVIDPTLSFIRHSDIENIFQIISGSHPQLISLILSRLDSLLSARLLELFKPEYQTEIITRITKLVAVAPELIDDISMFLRENLNTMTEINAPDIKGIDIATGILNSSSRTVEKNVIESLETMNSELAESIKNRMFVFEDIVLLDKKSISQIIEKAEARDFYLSMKMVNPEVSDFVMNSITKELGSSLKEGIDNLGRVKISDIEKAQLRIVLVIREMETNGEILVCHPDEIVE